jgi:hypothetical protein
MKKEMIENLKNGKISKLYSNYKNDEEFKKNAEDFRAGYYSYRRNDCGECLQCLGGLVCADTMCECFGGDICNFF